MADKLGTVALAVAVLAVGALAWWLQMRPALAVDPAPLAGLPHRLGTWESVDLPVDSAVESVLRADYNIQRAYGISGRDAADGLVWLYVGYYSTARGGRPEHTPRGCFTGAGWDIASARVVRAEDGSGRRLNEYVVERKGEHQLVHFWYRSARSTGLVGGFDQRLDQILGRLETGRADGALIRLSSVLGPGGEADARTRLLALGRDLDRQLADHWPIERPLADL